MTREDFIKNYWNYYLALENRFLQTTNFVEIHKVNIWYPGATYHVMSRGNRRTTLYKDMIISLSFWFKIIWERQSNPVIEVTNVHRWEN